MPRPRDRRRRRITVPVKMSETAIEALRMRSLEIKKQEEQVKKELEEMLEAERLRKEALVKKELEGNMLLALALKNDHEARMKASKEAEEFFKAKKIESLLLKYKKPVVAAPPVPDYKAQAMKTRNYQLLSSRARFFIDWSSPEETLNKLRDSDAYRIHLETLAKKS